MKRLPKIFLFIGFLEIVSGVIVYPKIAIYWRNLPIINYYKPMMQYSYFSIIIGSITAFLGIIFKKTKKEILINISFLFISLSFIFLSDRLLLAKYGLGLWEYDCVLHYKHRPNTTFSWGEKFENKLIKINSQGYHDDEFTFKKRNNELRIFVLGNSITMGHGVTKEETFSSQLELFSSKQKVINVFNLGVQGYSTEQELEVFKRELKFNPDIVLLEFCLNDITEPIYVNKDLGGSGFDYHRVFQTKNKLIGLFVNETGFGRFIYWQKYKSEISKEREKELFSIKQLSINPFSNEKFKKSWNRTKNSIIEIKKICGRKNIPFIILIFPYTFQLWKYDLQKPQQYLKKFLASEKIHYIDFTEVFENNMTTKDIKKCFLDEDHYTKFGHSIIAKTIFEFLTKNSLL